MSKKVISISQHPNFGPKKPRSRQRLFDLGRHEYMGSPGCSWMTNYWVKKVDKGRYWELYSSEETALSQKIYCGTFEPDALRDYFDDVCFWIDEDFLLSIGLGRRSAVSFPRGDDLIDEFDI
jgi:hypothetical protein